MADDSQQIKLLTIGDSGVGKSWLLLRWAGEGGKLSKSGSSMPTIGIDFKMKTIAINNKRVKVQIWDTAGQERFRTITTSYYRNSQGVLLVYDITDKNSFSSIRSWIAQINQHADVGISKILLGNKCDLISQRQVSFEEGEALAKEFKMPFMETSAFSDINVEEAFMQIAKEVHQKIESGGLNPVKREDGKLNKPRPGGGGRAITSEEFAAAQPKKKSMCALV